MKRLQHPTRRTIEPSLEGALPCGQSPEARRRKTLQASGSPAGPTRRSVQGTTLRAGSRGLGPGSKGARTRETSARSDRVAGASRVNSEKVEITRSSSNGITVPTNKSLGSAPIRDTGCLLRAQCPIHRPLLSKRSGSVHIPPETTILQ